MKNVFLLPLAVLVSFAIVIVPPILLDTFVISNFISSSVVSGTVSFFIWFMIGLGFIGYVYDKNCKEDR